MKEKRLIHLHSAERPEPVEGERADRSSLDLSDGPQSEQQAIDPAERRTDQLSKSADNVATPDQLKTGLRQNTVGVDDKGSYEKDGIFHGVIVYDLPGGGLAAEVRGDRIATTGAQVYAALGGGKNLQAENIAFRNGNETGYAYWDKEGDGGKGCYQVLDTKSGEIRKLVIPNGSHFVFEEGVEPSRIAELKDSINADQLLAVIDSAGELSPEQKAEEAKRIANGEEVAAQAELKIALEQGAQEKPFGTEEFAQSAKPTPKPAPARTADGFVRLNPSELAPAPGGHVNLDDSTKPEVAINPPSNPDDQQVAQLDDLK